VLQPACCRNAKHASPGAVRNKPGRLVFSISHHSSAKIAGRGYQKCFGMGKLWEKLGSRGVTLLRKVRRHGAAAWLRTSVKSWCSCCSAPIAMVVLTCFFLSLSISEISGAKFSKKSFRNWKGCEHVLGGIRTENRLLKAVAQLYLSIVRGGG
jgi:hypothetical protein